MTSRYSLLLVDDSEPNPDGLSHRLAQRGYAVTTAACGHDALALALTQPYDLVLLNAEMPEMSGLEVLSELRKTRSQTDLPIIMVTARTQGDDIVEAFRLGANDYLTTPVDFAVALARIGTHLAHKSAVAELRVIEERYALAVTGARDGLWDWNLTTNEVHWSARWKQMLGYGEAEVSASPDEWFSRVHEDDVDAVREQLKAHLEGHTGHFESEHRMRDHDGALRWVLCRGAAVWNAAGVATRLAGSLTDITDAKVADAVTGLPNRHLFIEVLDRAINRAQRRTNYTFALLVLGLDRLNLVNDTLGPMTADRLLMEVANRLQARLRPTDSLVSEGPGCTLARLGWDEFNVLIDDIGDASDTVRVAQRLRAAFEQPFDVDGQPVFISASVGIAISTTGYTRAEDILRDAVTALHRAQAEGTVPCEIFDPTMRERAIARLRIETDLRRAIDHEGFDLHYQPIVAVETGTITGFEALMRWGHPSPGMVGPAKFIPVAESTGMILHLGQLALIESCRRMADWQQRFGEAAPRSISVNVSSRQFSAVDFASEIEAVLDRTGLAPSSLKLEITESAFLNDLDAAREMVERLRNMGVGCSLDDFGTGYSSLSYLHQLMVETLKVDRSFLSRIGRTTRSAEMLQAIVSLGHSLGMDVVAEGVETREQLAQLKALGCQYAQGFYFSMPVTAAAAERLIERQPWAGDTLVSKLAS
ncbi:MAG: EAL domain-containing protein [Acidobacteria bacterium]|nr:EAL domain-containing protein [Acidobacteriota bacterium]